MAKGPTGQQYHLVQVEEPVELGQLGAGCFFLCGETVALKSEYSHANGAIMAIIADSGEFFWGGATTPEEQRKVIVQPLELVNDD